MIGNDVIDLAQSRIESRWQRRGFAEKLFTVPEQQLISNFHNSEIMVWLLWSMKEAAYKIYNRQTKIREFSPKKLSCNIHFQSTAEAYGEVICGENSYFTKSVLSPESIHTIAVSSLKDIGRVIEIENKKVITDENGIPYIMASDVLKPVSISHHGRFEKCVTIGV